MRISKEYEKYLREVGFEERGANLYEKACNFVEKIIKLKLSYETEKKFEEAIRFCYLRISPSGPASLVAFLSLLLFPLLIGLGIFGIVPASFVVISLVFLSIFLYYLYNYPLLLSKSIRAKASTEIVLAILYMSISLREIPNLERAVKFAAMNLKGPIGKDLRRILWDIQTGRYIRIEDALEEFLQKWRKENEEFVEAVKTLEVAVHQPEDRANKLINEAVNSILSKTVERMRHYAQDLRTPVTMMYALGVILPVMSLVIFPIVMIFLQGMFNTMTLVIFYDVIIPSILFWLMTSHLERKPPSVSQPKVEEVAGKLGSIKLFGKEIPILPIVLVISVALIVTSSLNVLNHYIPSSYCRQWQSCDFSEECRPANLELSEEECKAMITDVLTPALNSSFLLASITISIISYCFLDSFYKIRVRDKIKRMEKEFAQALYQLGHQVLTSNSVEVALERSAEKLRNFEIANFYRLILRNIKMGMTFEKAVFHQVYGAIRKYPSELIESIMKVVVETSRKGMRYASMGIITMSRYLKGMHNVEEEIRNIMSEITSSMKVLVMFIAPLVAGMTMAMTMIILNILAVLSLEMAGMVEGGVQAPSMASFLFGLWKNTPVTTPETFQIVLGIYVIETTILLSIFLNGIENGEDKVGERWMIFKNLAVAMTIYISISLLTYTYFGTTISTLLLGIG